jgi:RNA polymerase sigma-70 factor (ECF subfamily)
MMDRYNRVLELLESEGPRLHALLARLTRREGVVGDLLQELVTRLCQSRGLERARDPFAYAYRAAVNLAFEWHRGQHARMRADAQDRDAPAAAPSPLGAVIEEEELARVLDATARLPALARDAVLLRYLEQMSYEEIAQRLGKKPQHVRSLTSKALAQLRALLTNHNDGEIDGG